MLGGLAQGLTDGSSGALRAQGGDLVVYSTAANDSIVRSRVTADEHVAVADIEGVAAVRGFGDLVEVHRPDHPT